MRLSDVCGGDRQALRKVLKRFKCIGAPRRVIVCHLAFEIWHLSLNTA